MPDVVEYTEVVVPFPKAALGGRSGDGGLMPPGDSGGSDMWQAGVDRQLGELRQEVGELRKWLLGAVAASFLILAGGGFAYYVKLSDQLQTGNQNQTITAGDVRTLDAKLNGRLDLIIEKLNRNSASPDPKR